jgi:alpha-glucosidase
LDKVAAAGAAGVKVDFFDSEAKEKIDLQEAILRETARRRLMVFFHGCQPPSGEKKTWPHEMTREGIRGLELNRMAEGPVTAGHNCALPFTRLAVGHGDYTPLGFTRPGATTWAHQLATAVAFNSEFQVIAENPEFLLGDERARAALELIREAPTAWDETRVLRGSEIGECVAMARRKGGDWWVAVLTNGARRVEVDFGFLGEGDWRGVWVKSGDKAPLAREELRARRGDKVVLELGSGDGATGVFRR